MKCANFALLLCAALLPSTFCVGAIAEETIRIAFIEGLSGPFANVGEIGLRHYQSAAEAVNARGGVVGGIKLEIVPFDHKTSPQKAQLIFKQAAEQGIRYIAMQPLYISTLVRVNGRDVKFDAEKTGLDFRTDARVEGRDTVTSTTCKFPKP
jgi:ABC-type sugar transport system substrate-binding protein